MHSLPSTFPRGFVVYEIHPARDDRAYLVQCRFGHYAQSHLLFSALYDNERAGNKIKKKHKLALLAEKKNAK